MTTNIEKILIELKSAISMIATSKLVLCLYEFMEYLYRKLEDALDTVMAPSSIINQQNEAFLECGLLYIDLE